MGPKAGISCGGVDNPFILGLYRYVNQNPINYVDPDGNVAWFAASLTSVGIGATVGGLIGMVAGATIGLVVGTLVAVSGPVAAGMLGSQLGGMTGDVTGQLVDQVANGEGMDH